MLSNLTAEEWAECMEFYALEPFGFPALDAWHGMQCAVSIAPHMKAGRIADPSNYMLRPPGPQEMTPEQTVAFFRAALGGGNKKPKG